MPRFSRASATLATILLIPLLAHADGGCEHIPSARPVKAYPGSVAASDGMPPPFQQRLSKQGMADIRNVYAGQLQTGEFFQEKAENEARTLALFQRQTACGQTREVLALKLNERTADNPNASQAFGALKAMTLLGQHSEAEYQQVLTQYGLALKAYFRSIYAPDGKLIDEGRLILERCRKQEAQQRGETAPATSAEKQQAGEMRAKMQEMKARCDIAGMMQMAQQFQSSGRSNAAANQGRQEMDRDLWPLWLQCVKDMHTAAYRTRLDYSAVKD